MRKKRQEKKYIHVQRMHVYTYWWLIKQAMDDSQHRVFNALNSSPLFMTTPFCDAIPKSTHSFSSIWYPQAHSIISLIVSSLKSRGTTFWIVFIDCVPLYGKTVTSNRVLKIVAGSDWVLPVETLVLTLLLLMDVLLLTGVGSLCISVVI